MHLILIVEGDPATRYVLRALLAAEHYRCVEADTVLNAEAQARRRMPDLLLIDPGLREGDGLQVIRQVRTWSAMPILVLSGSAREQHKIASLDAGADDYVTKPFATLELLARIRAALRKRLRSREAVSALVLGDARIDFVRREAHGRIGDIHLTPLEYRVLECLARNIGFIVSQEQLLREVWGPEHLGDTRSLRACIKNLRAKIEPLPASPRYLINEMGVGYRLRADQTPAPSEVL